MGLDDDGAPALEAVADEVTAPVEPCADCLAARRMIVAGIGVGLCLGVITGMLVMGVTRGG